MKKIVSILLSLIMIMSLASCGSQGAASTGAGSADKFVVATNAEFPPYEYKEGQDFVGIDVDIVNAIANKLGKKLEVLDIAFDAVLPAVVSGKADLGASGITITEDRKQNVDFSIPYTKAVQMVIVTEDSDITSVDDLAGKKIGVQQGTTGDLYCTDDFGEECMVRYSKIADGVLPLKNGQIDCLVIDDQVAINVVKNNTGIKTLETAYAEEEYAFAIQKGNQELLDTVNEVIKELETSGELAAIKAKFIK